MAENTRWTHDELKSLLERGTLADLEKLIANPERKACQCIFDEKIRRTI